MSPYAEMMSGLCRAQAAPYHIATGLQGKLAEQIAQERLLHDHGLVSGGREGVIAPLRASIGSAFIRMGVRLRGQAVAAPA